MKRRAKGTGTIIKQNGYYYGRIVRNGKAQVIKLSTNQREAETLWKDWLLSHPTAPKTETAKHSLSDAWSKAESNYKVRAASRGLFVSYERYFKRFQKWASDRGKHYLEDITTSDIADYMEQATALQSKCTKKTHLYMIRDLWAYSLPDIPNPTRGIKIKADTQSIPREPLTDEEVSKLLEAASKYKYYPNEMKGLVMVGLYTGLRLTDCVHLKAENTKGDTVSLTPKKTKQKGILVRIPLHPTLKAELESTGVTEGYYFPNLVAMSDKGQLRWHTCRLFQSCLKTTTTQEGRRRKVPLKGFHALRATFITRLAQKGVSLPIMESLAGHLNPQMTMHYTHPDEDVKKAAIDVLGYGDEANDKVFMHPEVRKIVEMFEKQKQDFMEKMEATIKGLIEKGEITDSIVTRPFVGYQAFSTAGKNDKFETIDLTPIKRRILEKFFVLPPQRANATVTVKKDDIDKIRATGVKI